MRFRYVNVSVLLVLLVTMGSAPNAVGVGPYEAFDQLSSRWLLSLKGDRQIPV